MRVVGHDREVEIFQYKMLILLQPYTIQLKPTHTHSLFAVILYHFIYLQIKSLFSIEKKNNNSTMNQAQQQFNLIQSQSIVYENLHLTV